MEIITKLDKYGNVNADLVEVTALISGKNKVVPPPKPLTEVVEAVAYHQEAGYLPSTNDNLPSSAENTSGEKKNVRFSVAPDEELEQTVGQLVVWLTGKGNKGYFYDITDIKYDRYKIRPKGWKPVNTGDPHGCPS